uniref:Tubby-like F-box protein n=1 Tax=Rhizophora mucronata TaxID=61149 RepID=A0A2P2KLY2_RHIMU
MISKSNSGGRFAHKLCSTVSDTGDVSSGAMCVFVLPRQCFPPIPRLEMLPSPSFISLSSRTKLLRDILA